MDINEDYWNNRWANADTPWDIGYSAPAINNFIDTYPNLNPEILIPGCGNAYEAEYLYAKGFKNITLIDISVNAVDILKLRFEHMPEIKIVHADFFNFNDAFDLIIEQTFFCALKPELRLSYVKKMHQLLKEDALLVGLLFNREFENAGPPFGGTKKEYQDLFSPFFNIETIEENLWSIEPRKGVELFIKFRKKNI